MYKAAVIADDYSSAADCGVQFAKYGLRTRAVLNALRAELPEAEVISVNTDSRPLDAQPARARSKEIAVRIKTSGCERVYKSIDSTMRGNIGAEIEGVMEGLGVDFAVVAPGFPHYGRVIKNGIHYVNGIPLAESFMKNDPVCPVRSSSVTEILQQQSGGKVSSVCTACVRNGAESFLNRMNVLQKQGTRMAVIDTETELDLELLARYSGSLKHCLIAGSTGLSQYLPEGWRLAEAPVGMVLPKSEGTVLVAAASMSPVTARQIEVLAGERDVQKIEIAPRDLINRTWEGWLKLSLEAMGQKKDAVILTVRPDCLAKRGSREQAILSERIVTGMGELVKTMVKKKRVAGLVMTGGDAAYAVCSSLEASCMELTGEVEPGIPAGILEGTLRLGAVIKAGAFGTENALLSAADMLGGREK